MLDFLAHLEFERGLARNTLDAYRTDLLQYGAFLAARGRGAIDADRADVADFLADLATGNGQPACSPATINRKTACLRSFYRHLRREELIDADPTAALTPPTKSRKLPRVLTYGEVKRLLESVSDARSDQPSRPGAARGDVRLRAARIGGGRAGRQRGRPAARIRPPARQGHQGANGPAGPRGSRRGHALPARRPAAVDRRARGVRSCSSTSAAAPLDPPGALQDHPAARQAKSASRGR